MKLAVPNAIIFVLDPNHTDVEIPAYSGLVSRSGSCLSIGTQADVDGETEVTLDRDLSSGLICVYDGEIHTPTCALAVETSEKTLLAGLEGLGNTTALSIWVDDVKWPSRVSIVVPRI